MQNSLPLLNQLYELKSKISQHGLSESFERNFTRMFSIFEEEGFYIEDPTGENYSETRTDYEASIAGAAKGKLKIVRIIKPIVYFRKDGASQLLQKGLVIAGNE